MSLPLVSFLTPSLKENFRMSITAPPRDPLAQPPQARAKSPKRRQRKQKYSWKESLTFFLFVLPNLAVILIFSYWPTIYNAFFSLVEWDFVQPTMTWVGLQNYVDLFTNPEFPKILANTLIFSLFTVVGTLVGGLGIGLLLAKKLRFSGMARTLTFAPHMIPGAVVGILWLFMFDPNYGLSRWAFGLFGEASPQWTSTSTWSLWAIIIAYSWQQIGFVAIIYYTAIIDLPKPLYEAAAVDGAEGWKLFTNMTIPLLRPVTFFLLITGIIDSAQAFDIIATLTEGGPGDSSTTLTWSIYEEAFHNFDIGSSAAQSMVLFLILMALTAFQMRYVKRSVD